METDKTIILPRSEVRKLLSVKECIDAIQGVFNLYGTGAAQKPGILGVHTDTGGFHIKAGIMKLDRSIGR